MEGKVLVMRSGWTGARCRAVGLAAALWLVAGVSPLVAQAGRTAVEEANRLYAEGRFTEAHERYLDALRESPDSPVIRFNDGSALYQNAEFEQALQAYGDAIESGDPTLVSDAWYNIGNVLYRQQMLEQSLEAFKQSLRLDPSDDDAKHNLERVLEQMQQQQDDQNEQDDQQEDEQNQDEQEQDEDDDQQDQDQDQQEQEENDDQQDQDQDQQEQDDQQDQDQDDQSQQDPDDQEQPAQPPPGGQPQMSRDEAERLLDAIDEDQDEVNRPPRAAARGRRPRKDW